MFVVVALLCLGIALLVHEGGHFLAARVLGLRAHRLAFGVGPRLLTRFYRGTELVIRLLPVWAESAVESEPRRGWRWPLLLLIGPVVSVGFGLLLLVALHLAGTHVPVALTVGKVQPGSEAARAQLLPGDRVEALNGAAIDTWRELSERIDEATGTPLRLTVRRAEGALIEVEVTPRSAADGGGRIGISQQYVHRQLPLGEAVAAAGTHAINLVRDISTAALRGRRVGPRDTGGGWSLDTTVRALAAVSILLGLLHLAPLPPLDLGVALVGLWERRRGKAFTAEQRAVIQIAGFVVIAAAAVIVAKLRMS